MSTDNSNKKQKLLALALILGVVGLFLAWGTIGGDDSLKPPSAPEAQTAETQSAALEMAAPTEVIITGRAMGNSDALVKVVEYSSLTCGHCAHFHKDILPAIKAKYIASEEVYFQFEEFPLNAPALQASLIARCLPESRYVGFVELLFKTQEAWSSRPDYITPLKQNAKLAGLGEEELESCLNDKELRGEIAGEIKRATQKWNISSTPTFIITGPEGEEVLRGAQPLYEFERVFRKVSGGKVGKIEKETKE